MIFRPAIVAALSSGFLLHFSMGEPIWPNDQTDELERFLYEQIGFKATGVAGTVANCIGDGSVPQGRSFGAEWLRNAYHDMATADVFAGTGGMDASIVYELDRPENVGGAFGETLTAFQGLPSRRATLSDMFALAAVFAVGACSNGTIVLPFRGGRVDALQSGPAGRQGFNTSEMIAFVACGHALGDVHGIDFTEIVPFTPDADPANEHTTSYDSTPNFFENRVATEYVANTSGNPLVSGSNITTRSDFRIFNADGGVMMGDMAASNDYFISTCTALLERMINTVPKDVALTDPIAHYSVKPWITKIGVNANGTTSLSGFIRIEDSLLSGSNSEVRVHIAPRSATIRPSTPLACMPAVPLASPFFNWAATVAPDEGISSYTVEIIDNDTGSSVTYDNGGNSFPVDHTLQPQYALSTRQLLNWMTPSLVQWRLNLTVAVLDAERFTNVSAIFYTSKNANDKVSGAWDSEVVALTPAQKVNGTNYTYYTLSHTPTRYVPEPHPFDLIATGPEVTVSKNFIRWTEFSMIF
ncbi:heme peroxidase [Thozetella sp. PMI_491]|nr:heme peroxidase [Thozetella sp. PMI_491]